MDVKNPTCEKRPTFLFGLFFFCESRRSLWVGQGAGIDGKDTSRGDGAERGGWAKVLGRREAKETETYGTEVVDGEG